MSISYSIPNPAHTHVLEGGAWIGTGIGALTVYFSAVAMMEPHTHHLYGSISPAELTAWVTAICGVLTMAVNTALGICYQIHRYRLRRAAKRKRRVAKIEGGQDPK